MNKQKLTKLKVQFIQTWCTLQTVGPSVAVLTLITDGELASVAWQRAGGGRGVAGTGTRRADQPSFLLRRVVAWEL